MVQLSPSEQVSGPRHVVGIADARYPMDDTETEEIKFHISG